MQFDTPPWIAHLFQRQRLPTPRAAVARGAVACGPLPAIGLAAVPPSRAAVARAFDGGAAAG
ncbi:hypothetical protein [Streptomyces sp. NPDC018833]|uniref:hypothetical protein n=1 Tax=Streptomyces sp. NPDC018833 TaxID=3365053 RepID=UPI0037A2AD00